MTLDVSTDSPAENARLAALAAAATNPDARAALTARMDADPEETREWMESLDALIAHHGLERAQFILTRLLQRAQAERMHMPALVQTPYVNTIAPELEPDYPGDEEIELRIRRFIRWNAVTMVMRGQKHGAAGGHLATYASAATLYEVGFNHFFRGKDAPNAFGSGDHIFFQGHASPGVYARAFLEGRLTEDHLTHFRREVVPGQGLSSYPHPWLMPDFWEFPTVSMGLGPLAAIYQARYNRYLQHRGIADTSRSRVWAFLGDGETDEPEALGSLHLAAREGLSTSTSSSTATSSGSTGRCAATGRSIRSVRRSSTAPAGTSSRSCGAASGITCWPPTMTACSRAAWARQSTATIRSTSLKVARTSASTSSAPTRAWRRWLSISRTTSWRACAAVATISRRSTPLTPRPSRRASVQP
jgi:transketolase N-terminal domain/subunit